MEEMYLQCAEHQWFPNIMCIILTLLLFILGGKTKKGHVTASKTK